MERVFIAAWLSTCKLLARPVVFIVFKLDTYDAGAMIIPAALPVAGNVCILIQHYADALVSACATLLISQRSVLRLFLL